MVFMNDNENVWVLRELRTVDGVESVAWQARYGSQFLAKVVANDMKANWLLNGGRVPSNIRFTVTKEG